MGVSADLTVRDRGLAVNDTLVVADLHLGLGATGGFELPIGDGADVLERFRTLLDALEPGTVVLAGDVLHSFRTVPRPVQETFAGIEAAAAAADAALHVLPGNHDTMLASVWDGPTPAVHRVGETVVCHGHECPGTEPDRYVIGHDHPTIRIEGERRPCALVGPGGPEGRELVVLPAFNRALRGLVVNDLAAADVQSPLVRDLDPLRPVVPDGREALTFPPLEELRHRR